MLALPISMVVSLILGFLVLRSLLASERQAWPVPTLLAICAGQGLINALAQYYEVPLMRLVQPVTATLLPPLTWVAFQTTAVRPFDPQRDAWQLGVPAFTAFCAVFAPAALDLVVPAVFLAYGGALLYALRSGPDGLPLVRLERGDWPARVWRGAACVLILSAAADGLIFAAQIAGAMWLRSWIISLVSSVSLLLIGGLSLFAGASEGDGEAARVPNGPARADLEKDAEVMGPLSELLEVRSLYLDPGLTLSRLARRLGIPVKQVSAAVNRVTGENVSRYVNSYRIGHACKLLEAGRSVTDAMLESGFRTKSNFNREFQRVTGGSPTLWLARGGAASPSKTEVVGEPCPSLEA